MAAIKLDESRRRSQLISALYTLDEKQTVIKAALAQGIAPAIFQRRASLKEAEAILASSAK